MLYFVAMPVVCCQVTFGADATASAIKHLIGLTHAFSHLG